MSGPKQPIDVLVLVDKSTAALGELLRLMALPRVTAVLLGSALTQDWLAHPSLAAALNQFAPKLTLSCVGSWDADLTTDDGLAEAKAAAALCRWVTEGTLTSMGWVEPPWAPFPYEGTFRLRLREALAQAGVPTFHSDALLLERADGVRLTRRGYRQWAEAVANWVPLVGPAAAANFGTDPRSEDLGAPHRELALRQVDTWVSGGPVPDEWRAPQPTPSGSPAGTVRVRRFDSAVFGLQFKNAWRDEWSGTAYEMRGLCGGMAFAVCDCFYTNFPAPTDTTPPSLDTPLGAYIRQRQVDCNKGARARLGEWAAQPLESVLHDWTLLEWTRLRISIDAQAPVPIGLVSPSGNHAVVAMGYREEATGAKVVLVWDPNNPSPNDREIRLDPGSAHWGGPVALNDWRGWFVLTYAPMLPPGGGQITGPR